MVKKVRLPATPCAVNPDDLPADEDTQFVRDTLRASEVSAPTYRYTLCEAVSDGHFFPYRIYKARTVKTAVHRRFPAKRDELDWTTMEADTLQNSRTSGAPEP